MSLNRGEGRLQSPPRAPVRVEPGTAVQVAPPSWGNREAGRGAPGQQSLGGGPQDGPCTQALGWAPGNCFEYVALLTSQQNKPVWMVPLCPLPRTCKLRVWKGE